MKCTARRAGSKEQFFEVVFRALHKLAIASMIRAASSTRKEKKEESE